MWSQYSAVLGRDCYQFLTPVVLPWQPTPQWAISNYSNQSVWSHNVRWSLMTRVLYKATHQCLMPPLLEMRWKWTLKCWRALRGTRRWLYKNIFLVVAFYSLIRMYLSIKLELIWVLDSIGCWSNWYQSLPLVPVVIIIVDIMNTINLLSNKLEIVLREYCFF